MKRFIIVFGSFVTAFVAVAAPVASNEFRLDRRTGLREARATEAIRYSTVWATNLTAEAQNAATAVVKVNPVLKTPPKYLVVDMSGGPDAVRWPVSSLDEVPEGGWSDEYKTGKLVLRHIPAGSFIMGERSTDFPGATNKNLRMVVLTKDFYMGVFEVTQRQWELAMGTRPSVTSNALHYAMRPVELIDYDDARGTVKGSRWPADTCVDDDSFVGRFRIRTGVREIDLPTEAQWEYACRAGASTALYSGKEISDFTRDPNVAEIARYACNSGYDEANFTYSRSFESSDLSKATAKVGSYRPNAFGLYDMLGNVLEWVCDWDSETVSDAIDPVGPPTGSSRVIRGSCWDHMANRVRSSYRDRRSPSSPTRATGLRLCIRDASNLSIPDLASVLVAAPGEASADWTPTRAGTYLLTHEVQTNGVAVGAFETALFRVGGPELSIEPQGELTNGVEIAIGGADGWPVYYTTDGSDPTSMSDRYTGPFSLPSNAVVRAVAISEGGVSGDPARADFTLHDPFGLVGAVARPRYPWNGLVDVDFDLRGDPDLEYLVALEALDFLGHTNLPVRTVLGETLLAPGHHRVTWNAAADIAGEIRFPQVSVTVKATGSILNQFSRTLGLSVARYTGTETLTGVPTLVRLSEAIPGFRYADFASPEDGADLAFFDADENELPYEIDEWNTNGESLVWVKLPVLTNGVPFTAAYGNPQPATRNPQLAPHSVWSDYAGVWHMNEDAGTAFDSTEHHLDALPDHGTNELADISQMVAYENGACGRARVNATESARKGNYLLVPSYDALRLRSCFTVSIWLRTELFVQNARILTRKTAPQQETGWDVFFYHGSKIECGVRGSSGYSDSASAVLDEKGRDYVSFDMDTLENWSCLTCVFDGSRTYVYGNGTQIAQGAIAPVLDNGGYLTIGGMEDSAFRTLCGQYDEIRLRGGTLSADRIKADYDMIDDRAFLAYGAVEILEEAVKP